ncbi:MAG: P1 family peptidase [Actinobacteria bacterium]|nr:P1 family peptidase [Actinomycetota bacterium]
MITDVPGIRVGHHTDRSAITGCTVILCPSGTVGSVDVLGGAPGTRETDALRLGTIGQEVHAILLSGGSAFGLAAAGGVQRWLEERGIGFEAGPVRVPIVPAAVLFDLGVGDPAVRPGPEEGYAACEAAAEGPPAEGSVGAGTGATVAKLPDPSLGVKGGIGTASARDGELVVGAIAAVNSLGSVFAEDGTPIASNRGDPGAEPALWAHANTTLVCVATNARLSKEHVWRVAQAAQQGVTVAIRPAHTLWDGDTAFALATGEVDAHLLLVEELAARTTAEAIRRGVRMAEGLGGFPGAGSHQASPSEEAR